MKELSIIGGILIAALVAGMLSGVGVKAGIGVDEDSIAIMIMTHFCEALKPLETGATTGLCGKFLIGMIVFSIIFAALSVLVTAAEHRNIWKGLALYGVGWLAGFLFIILT